MRDRRIIEKVRRIQRHVEAGGANEELTAATVLCSEILAEAERVAMPPALCGRKCDHGSPCIRCADHEPRDRHETDHGCVFFDAPRR